MAMNIFRSSFEERLSVSGDAIRFIQIQVAGPAPGIEQFIVVSLKFLNCLMGLPPFSGRTEMNLIF